MTVVEPRPESLSRHRAKNEGRALTRAILRLPTDQRDVFLLNRMVGLTYDQIGLHLGMAPQTVQATLAAALVKLTRGARAFEAGYVRKAEPQDRRLRADPVAKY